MHENEEPKNPEEQITNNEAENSADATQENGETISIDLKLDSEQSEEDTSEVSYEKEVQESKEKYLRLYAEFDNYRRRTTKERAELIKSANEGLIKDLISVVDDFERAQKSMEEILKVDIEGKEGVFKEVEIMKQGFQLIYNNLLKTLTQKGLSPMESSIGKPFDVELHESLAQIPAPSEDMKGKIVDEIEKGYYLHDKVIRFAKVVIGS
jgi:molecular chaperone GrpE